MYCLLYSVPSTGNAFVVAYTMRFDNKNASRSLAITSRILFGAHRGDSNKRGDCTFGYTVDTSYFADSDVTLNITWAQKHKSHHHSNVFLNLFILFLISFLPSFLIFFWYAWESLEPEDSYPTVKLNSHLLWIFEYMLVLILFAT